MGPRAKTGTALYSVGVGIMGGGGLVEGGVWVGLGWGLGWCWGEGGKWVGGSSQCVVLGFAAGKQVLQSAPSENRPGATGGPALGVAEVVLEEDHLIAHCPMGGENSTQKFVGVPHFSWIRQKRWPDRFLGFPVSPG